MADKFEVKPVHTLNARGNVMLEVMRDYFSLSSNRMFSEIQSMRKEIEDVLSTKGIQYDSLKTALVPSHGKNEIALVFNSLDIDSLSYGDEVFRKILPLLDMKSDHSILVGDYIGSNNSQRLLHTALIMAVQPMREFEYQHSSQIFVVYINNLTANMLKKLDEGLSKWKPYVGFANTTFSSPFKTVLSTQLLNICIKHGAKIIQGHEDDRPNDEDVNMCGYPFEEYGYKCVSLQLYLKSVFLSYKIERAVVKGFEVDTEFSLNAVHSTPIPLNELEIEVEEAKLKYLKTNKTGSLKRAQILLISASELTNILKLKISDNYIYNMSFSDKYNVTKFNVVIEITPPNMRPSRLLASLEYKFNEKRLRLITLY